jgi:pimeloyl-ACP methyl ester carboxylesterase
MTIHARERLGAALLDAARDAEITELAGHDPVSMEFAGDGWALSVTSSDQGLRAGHQGPVDLQVWMADAAWEDLLSEDPPARRQSLLPLIRSSEATVTGDDRTLAQTLQLLRRVVELAHARSAPEPPPPRPLTMTGSYVRIDVDQLGLCDVYVERAGRGRPLVCFATAGSDSRQYHGLVTDTDLTDSTEIIAFDLPWHGKSNPAWGRRPTSYRLDSRTYVAVAAALIRALDLDESPVLLGPSMAGAAVIEVLAHHPDLVHGAVSCQAGPRVTGRRTQWLRDTTVNQTLHVPEWTYGLMSPHSPLPHRQRVWWGYSQGGFGTYDADLAYYTESWDVDHVLPLLRPDGPPVVVMSGVYDFTVPPEESRALAQALPLSDFREMHELGHFPHAENPAVFAEHLRWALGRIDELVGVHPGSPREP